MNHSEIVSFLWGVADLIRDTFKRGKYQDVILPLTVLRRLDCVLAPTKEKVLRRKEELRGRGLQDLDGQLRKASGFAFYNTSRYDFDKLRADAPQLAANLRNYIAGFSQNMREVLERFDFDNEEEGCRRRQGTGRRSRAAGGDPQRFSRSCRPRSTRTGASSRRRWRPPRARLASSWRRR